MARLEKTELSNSINAWRTKTNLTASYVGDLDNLNTSDSSSIVGAINSIESKFSANGEVETIAKTAFNVTNSGGGTYAQLTYDNTTGTFSFVRNAITQLEVPNIDAGKITTGTLDPARVPVFDAANIATGTIATARLPYLDANQTTSGTFAVGRIPNIDAAKVISGTLAIGRIPTIPSSYITDDGTDLPEAIIPPNIARKNSSDTITGNRDFAGTATVAQQLTANGGIVTTTLQTTGDILPAANNLYKVGSTTQKWLEMHATTFHGVATSANFADLAENYTTELDHPVGTVMRVSTGEVAETDACNSNSIPIGVVSLEPAYLMNAECEGQSLALKGRVPVRIVGPISKGDAVYAYNDGTASSLYDGAHIVGIALESNNNSEEKLVECVLKV